jgi:CBS domain containing-hemolysin-like protein
VIPALQLWLAPVTGAALTLWAAVIALAIETDAPLPRRLAARLPEEAGEPSSARSLHVIHLALLLAAGAMAAAGLAWWARPLPESLPRLVLGVLLVWLVGDLLPRVLAALSPDLVEASGRAARVSRRLFHPLLRLVAWIDRRGRASPPPAGSVPAAGDREMLHGVFALGDMTVAEVMTPRIDIVAADVADAREQVIDVFRQAEHSRLLVFEGHPDNVVGVIFAKDLLPGVGASEADWHALIRPASFVPEAKTLASQLRDFQRGPSHLAVVVDEFGGTAGLVTLEDILEQIVGEIRDEYDVDETAPIVEQARGRWLVQGGVPLADLEAELEHSFNREDVDTVGGLLLAVLGHVPRAGESVELGPFRMTGDQVIRRRVRRVMVERTWPEPGGAEEG